MDHLKHHIDLAVDLGYGAVRLFAGRGPESEDGVDCECATPCFDGRHGDRPQ